MKKTLVAFLFLILAGCVSHDSARNDTIYQASTLDALLRGKYEAFIEFSELKKHGDFGLGTFDNLDGEMVALDGEFYQIKSDGVVYPVAPDMKTPFADMIFFKTDISFDIKKDATCEEVTDEITKRLPSGSVFYAVRVDGLFEKLQLRSVPAQKEPFPGLLEAVKNQTVFNYENVSGTMLGFWFPDFMQGASITGFHFHFLSDDRTKGGHLMTGKLKEGRVKINYATNLILKLPETDKYMSKKNINDNLTSKGFSYH
ncbi:MAG: acetolactate decarboxylase [Nitrospirae bacterium]|nr:acetolactate decarboxylase [Nitrospirota bacterium]